MKLPMCTRKDAFHVEEELFLTDRKDRIVKILDAKYNPSDSKELTDNLTQLNNNQKK